MKSVKFFILVLTSILYCAPSAKAYIPPYWYALKSITQGHKDLKTLSIKSKITDNRDTYTLTTYYNLNERSVKILIYSFSGTPIGSTQFDLNQHFLSELLVQSNLQKLAESSNRFGIKVGFPTAGDNKNHEKSKLVRQGDRIGYLYGIDSSKKLILEKDSFTPLVIESPEYTVELSAPKLTRFIVIPRKWVLRKTGETEALLTEEITDVRINTALDSKESSISTIDDLPEIIKLTVQWLR